MSSDNRPWYRWFPKEFIADEKVRCLSDNAELIYRRALDLMWQSNACQLPSNCLKLAYGLSGKMSEDEFKKAWLEIQAEGFELFKTSECGKWIYSDRLRQEMQHVEKTSKKRARAGRVGGKANAKQM